MPHNMGHNDGVNCMVMADNKIFSGGRDENLFVWRAEKSPSGEMQLVQDWAPGLDRRIAPAKSRRVFGEDRASPGKPFARGHRCLTL